MGYNRRALSLKRLAQEVVVAHKGVIPDDLQALVRLPGIGKATACSIRAFAFNRPVVFIETNIRRVFIHFFFSDTDTVSDADLLPIIGQSLYKENPRVWYWALMDLGSVLKKTVPNPNRRSVHYSKQSPFEGSDREIRGMIIRRLLAEPGMSEKQLVAIRIEDPARIKKILAALISEGFIVMQKNRFFLAGK